MFLEASAIKVPVHASNEFKTTNVKIIGSCFLTTLYVHFKGVEGLEFFTFLISSKSKMDF